MKKICTRCEKEKDLDQFRPNTRRKDRLQQYCVVCDKAYQQEWYLKNKQSAIERAKKNNSLYKEWFKEFKKTLKCDGVQKHIQLV